MILFISSNPINWAFSSLAFSTDEPKLSDKSSTPNEAPTFTPCSIDVTQATLQTDLDILGIDRKISSLSQAEKVVLRYISTLRQAQIAQGDFANTMDHILL